jgi:flagellar hook-basal body complex protein FliE
MNDINVNQLLTQMRAMTALAQGQPVAANGAAGGADFATLLKGTVDKVNETQQQAGGLAQAFEEGNSQVDLAQVMIAMQKANISFQAMTQVRNKLVSAYQDIMSMQV